MIHKSPWVILFLVALLSGLILVLIPFIGMDLITPAELIAGGLPREIFFSLRVPRTLTAFFAGGGLALCGMVFQAMFRNPLADPFTLGIASGASCGAAVVILLGAATGFLGMPLVSFGAFVGAALSMALVYGIASFKRSSTSLTMLLAGISVSFMFSSLLMFMQYLSNLRESFHIVRWLMGGIEVFGYKPLLLMLPFVLGGGAIVFFKLAALDQLLAGEDIAKTRGVNIKSTKLLLLAATSFIVGSIVSVCGPIGFVGLMIPHICRIFIGARHRFLGPACFLIGGTFLVACDAIARMLIAPAEIPVGVITALLGGPFFLWILFGKKNGRLII